MASLESNARSPPLIDSGKDPRYYSRGVRVLSVGFLGVFGGFQAAQGLQSSLNATLGFINLACLYGTFTVLCLVAPPLLSYLEAAIGMRLMLFGSAVTYAGMAISNIYTKNWVLPIAMNILVGVGAPILWTCQNDYVGRCAYHATQCGPSGDDDAANEPEATRLAGNTAKFNSTFFSIYQFAGAGGNIAASVLMLLFSGTTGKDVLFLVLGGFSGLGALCFLMLPRVAPGAGQEEQPSLRATGALAIGDFRMRLMVPFIFTNGMTLGFIFGDFATDITCPVIGPSIVGFVMAFFFFVNSLATICWGRLIERKLIRRRTAYVAATVFTLAYLVIKLLWKRPQNYELVEADNSWHEVYSPQPKDFLVTFGMVFLFACGDAFWESGPTATLQNFFLGTPDCVPAMANYKLWQSLGLAVQFVLGASLKDQPELRTALLLGLCCLSLLCILGLDRLVSVQ